MNSLVVDQKRDKVIQTDYVRILVLEDISRQNLTTDIPLLRSEAITKLVFVD